MVTSLSPSSPQFLLSTVSSHSPFSNLIPPFKTPSACMLPLTKSPSKPAYPWGALSSYHIWASTNIIFTTPGRYSGVNSMPVGEFVLILSQSLILYFQSPAPCLTPWATLSELNSYFLKQVFECGHVSTYSLFSLSPSLYHSLHFPDLGWHTFSVMSQRISILDLAGLIISVTTT